MNGQGVRFGRVATFDAATGLGTLNAHDGGPFAFHCVEIADGSRQVDVGTDVAFTVVHKLGTLEAVCLTTPGA